MLLYFIPSAKNELKYGVFKASIPWGSLTISVYTGLALLIKHLP